MEYKPTYRKSSLTKTTHKSKLSRFTHQRSTSNPEMQLLNQEATKVDPPPSPPVKKQTSPNIADFEEQKLDGKKNAVCRARSTPLQAMKPAPIKERSSSERERAVSFSRSSLRLAESRKKFQRTPTPYWAESDLQDDPDTPEGAINSGNKDPTVSQFPVLKDSASNKALKE